MACNELIRNPNLVGLSHLDGFFDLASENQMRILDWFVRAWTRRDCPSSECFDAFADLWRSFNNWAALLTGSTHRDRDWMDILTLSDSLSHVFDQLIRQPTSQTSVFATRFYDCWPILDSRTIKGRHIEMQDAALRKDIVLDLIKEGSVRFEPRCWQRHTSSEQNVPLDWPHCLAALYQVRCTLEHGGKSAFLPMNQEIVGSAFGVLLHFLVESGCIPLTGLRDD